MGLVDVLITNDSIEILRLAILISIFTVAAYMDLRSRIISDKIWIVTGMIAGLFFIYDVFNIGFRESVIYLIVSFIFIGGISYIFYALRIFYGADHKGFIAIALLAPTRESVYTVQSNIDENIISLNNIQLDPENISEIIILFIANGVTETFGFAVFVNASIAGCLYFVWNILVNIKRNDASIKHPIRSSCAQRTKTNDIDSMYGNIIYPESESSNPVIRFIEFVKSGLNGMSAMFFRDYIDWAESEINRPDNISEISKEDVKEFLDSSDQWESTDPDKDAEMVENITAQDEVWITPGAPFIVFMLVGIVLSAVFGNVLFLLIH